jgi:hypothetical protein
MAAFETEWHFENRRDPIPQSVIVRLGDVAHEKKQSGRNNQQPDRIFDARPTSNSDWMVAVEITEPKP